MGNWCLHASSFFFDRIIIKVAGNQDRYKSSDEFDFGPLVYRIIIKLAGNQGNHKSSNEFEFRTHPSIDFRVTCP